MNSQDNNSEISLLKQQMDFFKQELSDIKTAVCSMKEVLTLSEAAIYLGITKSALYKLTHFNEISYYKPNGKICYFERSELKKWQLRNKMLSKAEVAANAEAILNSQATK